MALNLEAIRYKISSGDKDEQRSATTSLMRAIYDEYFDQLGPRQFSAGEVIIVVETAYHNVFIGLDDIPTAVESAINQLEQEKENDRKTVASTPQQQEHKWELMIHEGNYRTERMQFAHGWLVRVVSTHSGVAITFVPNVTLPPEPLQIGPFSPFGNI